MDLWGGMLEIKQSEECVYTAERPSFSYPKPKAEVEGKPGQLWNSGLGWATGDSAGRRLRSAVRKLET